MTPKKLLLRISPDLWDELQRWAKDELRSVNGQIEYVLREAVQRRRRSSARKSQTRNGEEGEGEA